MTSTLAVAIGIVGTLFYSPAHCLSLSSTPHLSVVSGAATLVDRSQSSRASNWAVFPTLHGSVQISQGRLENEDFPQGSRPGGTRGGCPAAPQAFQILLFQQQEGFLVSGQPRFFWYMSASTPVLARFVLLDVEESQILFEQLIKAPKAGFLQATLPANRELLPGRKYRWSVTLVCNPSRPSENLVAQGQVQRVPVPADLARQLAGVSSDRQQAQIYAQHGFWYEALAAIVAARNAHPQDLAIREEMLSFLERMGQTWVVRQERQR
jgi:hypothetical protein